MFGFRTITICSLFLLQHVVNTNKLHQICIVPRCDTVTIYERNIVIYRTTPINKICQDKFITTWRNVELNNSES